MKFFTPSCAGMFSRALVLLTAVVALAANTARAGLTFTVDLYVNGGTYVFYTPMNTNGIAPAAPLGVYSISSPQWPTNGSWRKIEVTSSGVNTLDGHENPYTDLASALQQITNGNWTIQFTNATVTNYYTFKVSLPGGLTTNQLPATLITSPVNGANNLTNRPTFVWQGQPTNWPVSGSLYVYQYNNDNSSYFYYPPGGVANSQTNWTIPVAIPASNPDSYTYFNLNYVTNYTGNLFVATTPLNTNNAQPIAGWSYTSTLESGASAGFTVAPPASADVPHTLIAHYAFDNSGDLGHDSSTNGNDVECIGCTGDCTIFQFTNNSEAGGGAVQFFGDSWMNFCGAPTSWTSALSGSFTVSAWINTTNVVGNDNDPLNDSDGQEVVYLNNNGNGVIPLGITGTQAAIATGVPPGAYGQDTLNSVAPIPSGSYVHVVVTRDQGSGLKQVYINGVLDSSDYGEPGILAGGTDWASIGGQGGAPFTGLLDDVQIYAGALSASEIAFLYNNPGQIASSSDFNTVLNTTGLTWTTSGDANWFVETTNTYNGDPAAAQSGSVTNSQTSTISVTVTGPGTLTFYWASQDDCNNFYYEFDIDGSYQNEISCSQSWIEDGPYTIPAGQHTLTWTTYANGDTDPTEAGYLDQVSFVQDTAPTITLNPFNQTNYPGYNVALLAAATNSSAITWQWFEVGNASPISNATNALFIPTNSGTAGVVGSYYAVASSLGGSTPTTSAAVNFVSAPLPPDWAHALKSPFFPVDGSVFNKDYYLGCAVDSAGDVYATAQYYGSMNVVTNGNNANALTAPGSYGAALVKHAANGNALWAVGLTNNQTGRSYGGAVAVAPGNGAYQATEIIGTNWLGTNRFVETAGGSLLLSRFDASGSNVWSKLITGTNFVYTSYNMLVSDASGNVTLAGFMSGTVSFGGTNLSSPAGGGFLVQYDANGAVRWAQTVPVYTYGLAYGSGLLYVSLQSAVISGVTNASIGSLSNVTDRAWAVACLNAANGQPLWLHAVGHQYGANFSGELNDMPLIAVSGTNVFLTANAYGSSVVFGGLSVPLPGGRGQYFARYDTNGTPRAASVFGSPTTMIWASAANASGVYVSGDFDSYSQFGNLVIAAPLFTTNDLDYSYNGFEYIYFTQPLVAKFDLNGNPLWARNGVSSAFANFRGIATTSDGVWASGFLKVKDISSPAQFGTNYVSSDLYVPSVGLSTIIFTQAGMIAKITDGTAAATPVTLLNPSNNGANFQFQFLSESGFNHNILYRTNLAAGSWLTNSTIVGDGTVKTNSLPYSLFSPAKQGFIRVSTQ